MKKLFLVLLALLVGLFFANGAFCAEGDEFSTTSFRINSDGQVVYEQLVEVITTDDTITAGETGKLFAVNISSGNLELTLPDAVAGLTYRITAINGSSKSGQSRIYIDPQAADYLKGCLNTKAGEPNMAVSDSLYSPGVTGDSVTLTAVNGTTWVCSDRVGTWVDGGTAPLRP